MGAQEEVVRTLLLSTSFLSLFSQSLTLSLSLTLVGRRQARWRRHTAAAVYDGDGEGGSSAIVVIILQKKKRREKRVDYWV